MPDKERLAIALQYARLSEAVRTKDVDALRALHTPEYREIQIAGDERDLAEVIIEWRCDFASTIEPSLQTEIETFALDRGEAKVGACWVQAFISSPFPARRYSNQIETTRLDVWTKTAAEWRLRRSEKQAIRSCVDGMLDSEATYEPPLTPGQRSAVVRDLRARALPFASVLAGNGFDDLAGLDRLIGEARIVALGEASHGSAEFFQMKHRLFEYLVERKGFSVLAIEGNWPEAEVADSFIKTGEGDPRTALAAMYFWTWQTEEVAALLHWMRQHNAIQSERPALSFSGFDMQVPNAAIRRVIHFLNRAGSAERDTVQAHYEGMEKLDIWGSETPAEENTRLADRARKALDLIDARRETLLTVLSPEEYRNLRQAAHIVAQAFARRAGIPGADRDHSMAENVSWLVEKAFPGQKIVLWAHNGHVATSVGGSEKSLGAHLRERYRDQMVVVGLATHHGAVRAKRMKDGRLQPGSPLALPLAPARNVSIEAVFRETGLPCFILDLRDLPKDSAASAWLSTPKLHRMIGAVYDGEADSRYYAHVHLPETYNCIIFIEQSTAAKPL